MKHRLDDPQHVVQILQMCNSVNIPVCLVLLERCDIYVPDIPIFNAQDLVEFHDTAVALDVSAANILEQMPAKDKYYLPIEGMLGHTPLKKINNIQEVFEETPCEQV